MNQLPDQVPPISQKSQGKLRFGRACLIVALISLIFLSVVSPARREAGQVAKVCPSGWTVATNGNEIVFRRNEAVWIMGKVSNPPRSMGESDEHYFKTAGREIHYEIRLRFVHLLASSEYERLRTARQDAKAALKKGASGKSEYTQLQIQFEKCQVPLFFTTDSSIFMDRWVDQGAAGGYRIEP